MAPSSRAFMLNIFFTLLCLCFTSNAASVPRSDCCTFKEIIPIVKLLSKYPTDGQNVCKSLLHRNPPSPVTTTKSTTIKTTVTATDTNPVTVKKGQAFAVVSSTTISTAILSSTATLSSAVTVVVTSTASATVVVTDVVTQAPPPGNTVTQYTATYMYKRNRPTCLGDVYHGLPKEVQSIKLDQATEACECYFKSLPTPTVTVTKTITAHATVTIHPKSTTIPATTSTSVDILEEYVTLTAIATITDYTTLTVTDDVTLTQTNTETTTFVPSASVDTVEVLVDYELVYGNAPLCAYNRYYSAPSVTGSYADNYQQAFRECQDDCTADPNCKFFAFSHFNPALARGFAGYECDLDSSPFDSSLLQCNYVTDYFVAYNKVTPPS